MAFNGRPRKDLYAALAPIAVGFGRSPVPGHARIRSDPPLPRLRARAAARDARHLRRAVVHDIDLCTGDHDAGLDGQGAGGYLVRESPVHGRQGHAAAYRHGGSGRGERCALLSRLTVGVSWRETGRGARWRQQVVAANRRRLRPAGRAYRTGARIDRRGLHPAGGTRPVARPPGMDSRCRGDRRHHLAAVFG